MTPAKLRFSLSKYRHSDIRAIFWIGYNRLRRQKSRFFLFGFVFGKALCILFGKERKFLFAFLFCLLFKKVSRQLNFPKAQIMLYLPVFIDFICRRFVQKIINAFIKFAAKSMLNRDIIDAPFNFCFERRGGSVTRAKMNYLRRRHLFIVANMAQFMSNPTNFCFKRQFIVVHSSVFWVVIDSNDVCSV